MKSVRPQGENAIKSISQGHLCMLICILCRNQDRSCSYMSVCHPHISPPPHHLTLTPSQFSPSHHLTLTPSPQDRPRSYILFCNEVTVHPYSQIPSHLPTSISPHPHTLTVSTAASGGEVLPENTQPLHQQIGPSASHHRRFHLPTLP